MPMTQEPPVNQTSKGAIGFKGALMDPERSVWLFSISGAPTNGANGDGGGWAGPGSLLVDATNAFLYINTNTKASPTWTKVGSQS